MWRRIVEMGGCRVPPGYSVYQSPYLSAAAAAATPGVVSLQPGGISHAALAAAAAATSQFYEYQNAAAAAAAAAAVSYPSQAYANGFETYPYTTAAGMFSLLYTLDHSTLCLLVEACLQWVKQALCAIDFFRLNAGS